jgi:GNAT superfamily N-acetyltransferase
VRVVYGIDRAVPAHERSLAWRYGEAVPAEAEIAPVHVEEFEQLLPLIAAYQRFYEAEEIDEERNRTFFRGYACLYWHFSSLEACESVLMNDLYVEEGARDRGVGRALIEATTEIARERGVPFVEWSTAPDNRTAQRLYDATGAERTEWFTYELRV